MLDMIFKKIEDKFYRLLKSIKIVAISTWQRFYRKVSSRKFIVISISTIVTIFFLCFGGYQYVTNPNTCGKCHEMRPEYATWANSQHNRFSCVDCHYQKQSFLAITKDVGVKFYKHIASNYVSPIEVQKETKNQICMGCHSSNRITNPSGDLEFDHTMHVQKGYYCVQCHTGSVHGSIAEKGYTTITDYNKWTVNIGKAYMKPKFTVTNMQICMECHKEKEIKTTCADCHNSLGNPKSHRDKAWKTRHGPEAMKNIDSCDRCHLYSMSAKPQSYSNDSVANYARNNKYCAACHLGVETQSTEQIYFTEESPTKSKSGNGKVKIPAGNMPEGHTTDWKQSHQYKAKADQRGCLVCHEENRSSGKNATKTYCAKCHQDHTKFEQVKNHPKVSTTVFSKECVKCHSKKTCGKCHYIN